MADASAARVCLHTSRQSARRAISSQYQYRPYSSSQFANTTNDKDDSKDEVKSGPSRDMTLDAESSSSSSSTYRSNDQLEPGSSASHIEGNAQTAGLAEEDRQFAEIFNTLKNQWPKPNLVDPSPFPPHSSTTTSHDRSHLSIAEKSQSIRPVPLGPKLSFHAEDMPPPRIPTSRGTFGSDRSQRGIKGVHGREKRSAGQTPHEADAFNKIIAEIFSDLNSNSPARSSNGGGSGSGSDSAVDPYAATRGGPSAPGTGAVASSFGLPRGAGSGVQGIRNMFERGRASANAREDEEDDQVTEELDMLKEEMQVIGTDIELLEWSKRRVFAPAPLPSSTAASSTSAAETISDVNSTAGNDKSYSFTRAYPRILAHLLKTLRTNYNSPHLVLSLFNYAKNHSFESYLFGCHSGAYNEVLSVKWESFRDLEGVEEGIREMEVMGLRWDLGTVRLVGKVVDQVGKEVLQSGGGGRWGEEVLGRLANLDKRVQSDVFEQERYYERQKVENRRKREEMERKQQRELKDLY